MRNSRSPGEARVYGGGARLIAKVRTLLTALFLGAMAAGCNNSNSEDLVPDKDIVTVPIGGVGHYGEGITVTEFSINGNRGGRIDGWGGGGAGHCCVLLPRLIEEPLVVTVKWTTTRTDVDQLRMHEATVPIHFAVQPGLGGSGLYVHFLPGHKCEMWFAGPTPASSKYPGPKYPGGPAPPYEPLPDEAPRREAPASE